MLKRCQQRDRALRELAVCGTSVLGGHAMECKECGHSELRWNACKNRNCPQCNGGRRRKWFEERREEILPVEYHHLVFTIPQQLADLAEYNDVKIYDILFHAVAEALLYVGKRWKVLEADLGFTAVLHTWGSLLQLHPHIHILVPAGGLSFDAARWNAMPAGFYFPKEMLREQFRKRCLKKLLRAYNEGRLKFYGRTGHLEDPVSFNALMEKMKTCYWNLDDRLVTAEREGETAREAAEGVLAYLARYVRRTAISNDRLIGIENDAVLFSYKDRRDDNKEKVASVPVIEFIDLYLQHVLPRGKRHVRNYGYLSGRRRRASLKLLADLFDLNVVEKDGDPDPGDGDPVQTKDSVDPDLCPCCQQAVMHSVREFPRPTVHEIMQMPIDAFTQPRLPFT